VAQGIVPELKPWYCKKKKKIVAKNKSVSEIDNINIIINFINEENVVSKNSHQEVCC
jgi:hypothetical protein